MFMTAHKRQEYTCNKCDQIKYLKPQVSSLKTQKESIVDSFVLLNNSNKTNTSTPSIEKVRERKRIENLDLIRNVILNSCENNTKQSTIAELITDPLCTDCADSLVQLLDDEIDQLQSEIGAYEEKLLRLEENMRSDKEEIEEEEKYLLELERLMQEEEKLRSAYNLRLREHNKHVRDADKIASIKEDMEKKQVAYWNLVFKDMEGYSNFLADSESTTRIYENLNAEMSRMKNMIPENTIDIWYEGEFGTINGLRLGSLPTQPVDWEEINAAWGLCTLLLHLLAKQKQFTFSMYKPIPGGSTSQIEDIEDGMKFDLFFTSQRNLASFNKAIRCFLSCLNEFRLYVESKLQNTSEKAYKVYEVNEDAGRIGGLSVEYSKADEVDWTKALKHMLLTLKFLQRL